jgi:hypothetical protein
MKGTNQMTLANVTKLYLQAREAVEQAEKIKAQAEAELKEALAKNGAKFAIVDGIKVSLVEGERAKYDADALANLVKPGLYKQVIKTEIDGKKFKAAVELGTIKPEVAQAVTTFTYYQQIRVAELAKAEAEASVARVA